MAFFAAGFGFDEDTGMLLGMGAELLPVEPAAGVGTGIDVKLSIAGFVEFSAVTAVETDSVEVDEDGMELLELVAAAVDCRHGVLRGGNIFRSKKWPLAEQ